jgi:hypothetical protein
MRKVILATSLLISGYYDVQAQSGTPEERSACSRDASRLCRKEMADGDNAVQQCLQQHRARLSRACSKVFQAHGM